MYFKRAMAKSRQSARTPNPKVNDSRAVPGLWELQMLLPPHRTSPGWPPRWDLVLGRAPGQDHSCFARLRNHRRTTEKEKSEAESKREPSTLQPTTCSTMAQLQLSYQAKEQTTRLEELQAT